VKPSGTKGVTTVIIQIVKFESELSEDEVLETVMDRIEEYRAMPGLLQKYYVKSKQSEHYAGIYVWDSMESLSAFRGSELAATIPQAYKIKGEPSIEVLDVLVQLREQE
jgi:heme-degrading monooxygenase HmoA